MPEDYQKDSEPKKIEHVYGHYKLEIEGEPTADSQFYQEALNFVSIARALSEQKNISSSSDEYINPLEIIRASLGEYGATTAKIFKGELGVDEGLEKIADARNIFIEGLGIKWPPQEPPSKTVLYKPGNFWAERPILNKVMHDAKNTVFRTKGWIVKCEEYRKNEPHDGDLERAIGIANEEIEAMPVSFDNSIEVINSMREPKQIALSELIKNMTSYNKLERLIKPHLAAQASELGINLEGLNEPKIEIAMHDPNEVDQKVIYLPHMLDSLLENVTENITKAYLATHANRKLPDEGIEIRIDHQVGQTKNGVSTHEVVITDNGIGPALQAGENEFHFEYGKTSWDGTVKGTGMGMAPMAELIRDGQGDLFLRKRRDGEQGTETVICLPVASN